MKHLLFLYLGFLFLQGNQSKGQSIFLLGILVVDSSMFDKKTDGVELNVDFRDECNMVKKQTGKILLHSDLEQKLTNLSENGLYRFSFVFHDIARGDSTFIYWNKLKLIINKVPRKEIDLEFKKVDFLPSDFFADLGSIERLSIGFDELKTEVNCSVINNKLKDFLFRASRVGKNAKLLIPLNVENVIESSNIASIPIEVPKDKEVNYETLTCSSINLNRFVFGPKKMSYLSVNDNHGTINLTSNVISNVKDIDLNLGLIKTVINVENGEMVNKANSITLYSDIFIDENIRSKVKIKTNVSLFKVSDSFNVSIENCSRAFVKEILSHSSAKEIRFSNSRLYIDNSLLEKLKTMPLVIFSDVDFINKTRFSLEQIKNQLPNCTFYRVKQL